MATAVSAQSVGDEPTAWQLLDDGDPPPGDGVLVYDTVRQVPVRVLHGGLDQPSSTWELIGDDWVRRFLTEPTPHAPGGSCFAFDPDRGVTVVFGGKFPETWEFDGTSWTRRVTATTPPDRSNCSMVYDTSRMRMVMFGGFDGDSFALGDHWEYDGVDWAQEFPRDAPPPRAEAAMAYDVASGKVVLFGGWTIVPSSFVFGDLWEYDGRNWRQKSPSPMPAPRRGAGMAYDPVRERVVMFGGASLTAGFDDTWEWDGRDWTEVATPTAPSERWSFRMDYDTARGRVIGHGGYPNDGRYNDTWIYDGTAWTRIAISGLPYPRYLSALTYDPVNDELVMHGGRTAGPHVNLTDTWSFRSGEWAQVFPVRSPSANWGFRLAWDPDQERIIGFSGWFRNVTELPQELHEYDSPPPDWNSSPSCCVEGRSEYGWTHFPELEGMLLFGGRVCCIGLGSHYPGDDTWLLEGTTWTELSTSVSPTARSEFAMDYHAGVGRIVLHGGTTIAGSPSGKQPDTWVFDGMDWQQTEAVSAPGARYGHSMVYDSARDRLVMYGDGEVLGGTTWEFDGTQWIARSTPFQPDPDRCENPLAYDTEREVVILFGGRDCAASIYWNDTWAYGPDPDDDGIVGGLDNCRQTANESQANADGDAAGDACDCAASDPGSFALPIEVDGLTLDGGGTTYLSWTDQSADVGDAVVYDVATGTLSDLRSAGSLADATCLGSGFTTPSASDGRTPTPGDGYWYLVRSRNACGTGSHGAGREALDGAPPCP